MGRYLNVDVGGCEETVELLKVLYRLQGSSLSREIKAWIEQQAAANREDLQRLRATARPPNEAASG